MKKTLFSSLSLLLALVMLLGVFAGCDGEKDETDTKAPVTSEKETTTETNGSESDTESDTEKQVEDETQTSEGPTVQLEGEHADLIELSNNLANGVQAFFPNANRTHYSIQNQEMTMNYARSATTGKQLVESIKNTKGAAYVQETMDVFLKMKNGDVFYASDSGKSAEANLYRFGYYYFEGLFEFQDFIPKDFNIVNEEEIALRKFNQSRSHNMSRKMVDNEAHILITDTNDPWFVFDGFNYDTAKYDTLIITAKALGTTNAAEFYLSVNNKSFNSAQKTSVSIANDGEYHDYYIPLSIITGYEGVFTGFRMDPSGGVGSGLAIKQIKIGKAELGEIPQYVSINRHFHVYSDKMHQAIQFAATETTTDIESIGMLTEIAVDTVAKLIVEDKDGNRYESLDAVPDWSKVIAVGFDIKDAGIFGYILPIDEKVAGSIKVTEEDGKYVIIQELTPENNTIVPSIGGVNDKGNYIHASGVKNNGNDVYIGQRIYTDENHDFDEFLFEAYCERNPLTANNIRVNEANSDRSYFQGYDSLRGIYILNLVGVSGGFYQSYNIPNKNYRCNFNVVGLKEDRDIYIMTSPNSGVLECAALLDDELMMLPVPLEVIKNFSEATGERNLYNIDDPSFGEVIFCLPLEKGAKYEYNIISLYQNWGKYPLKQLSQIPFHCPYYHLSTGATETNCILPWFGTANVGKSGAGNTLPDFRSMSAPFWKGQPQHNSCGSHYWLAYTDADGGYYATESTLNTITSYGPTYAEVVMDAISDDGKIKVTYTHMEMPQLDENRTFYTMEYEFLEDLTINDFRHKFQFYNVTDNDGKGSYKKVGYLNEQNEYAVVDAIQTSEEVSYVLGKECPYFSFFCMPDWNKESTSAEGYSNVAFLVYNSEFVIGGEKADPNFIIVNKKNYVRISLDLDTVEFKAGDKMTINAILLPWGSQLYEDGIIDEATGNYEYDMELPDGTLYQDKNVRDVRENTCLNPLTVTSETDEIIDSPFLPRVRSKDSKTAQFTLSGGENNVSVRVYGFDMLTAPKIEEFVNGEWVEYVVNSATTPDSSGYYHYYDGYGVQLDDDGKYSYSFVTTMYDGAPRTFRVTADEAFRGWPQEQLPQDNEDFLKVYTDAEEIAEGAELASHWYGAPKLAEDKSFVSVYVNPENASSEAYTSYYTAPPTPVETGNYFVIKYRVPKTNTESLGNMEIWAKTSDENFASGDSFYLAPKATGEWVVEIIDLSTSGIKNFKAAEDGKYYATRMRVDHFNKKFTDGNNYIDIAFIGIDSDLKEICALIEDEFEYVTLKRDGKTVKIATATGEEFVQTYVDPSSGYTQSTLPFGTLIDSINGSKVSLNNYSKRNSVSEYSGVKVTGDLAINLAGWAVIDGGAAKYVWSVDSGKTWTTVPGSDSYDSATDAMISNVTNDNKVALNDPVGAKKNGYFKINGKSAFTIDLSAYEGKTVNIIIGVIPALDEKTILPLYYLESVVCEVASNLAPESQFSESARAFGAHFDYINDALNQKNSSSATGFLSTGIDAMEDGKFKLQGWVALDGGVKEYYWTADKGVTWNKVTEGISNAYKDIIDYGQKIAETTFTDAEKSMTNGRFQVTVDLSAYKGSKEPVEVIFAAVPQEDAGKVCILFKFMVKMP